MKIKILFMVIILLLLSACGASKIKDPLNWQIDDFTYTDQNGKPFSLKDLEGKVWVADFVFTNCDTICIPMTSNMKSLQDEVKKEGIENIQFVSFSIDPTIDTPQVLTEYGNGYGVDFSNWHFLTGYSQEHIQEFAKDSFKAIVIKPKTGDQVVHGTSFYLVNGEGKVMKDYNGVELPMEDIINDIKTLQK